jgi:hypothetical protein
LQQQTEHEMSTLQQVRLQARKPHMRQVPNASHRLDEHILRALNKIKKPGTAEELTELLNRDLGPGDQPFQVREVATWLRNAEENVLCSYWLGNRPRR